MASTHAKHHVYLVSDANKASHFISELINNKYEILCGEFIDEKFQDKVADIVCSECKIGYMALRDSQHGSFFGCSHYPRYAFIRIGLPMMRRRFEGKRPVSGL
ncbi:hypothetical protein METHB2_780018 [Candidatus Methylobacter favarea]|uniref:DNA topoisomerase type IA zn finger domain-containing protein n=1 Tax=Candidatus Methylobacter favarea TaxID=2707345 RepID=A0A8S0WLJ3_9GAMM|nr:topoisomerase DNA-binding C4 zinc finger domain-containing protein [Candidatus Methylobacter favarea]CAA9892660.1 hypothetical protein METHB2_780018 [Candidatus Methylobacter favarea]